MKEQAFEQINDDWITNLYSTFLTGNGVVIDSREVSPGDIFFALNGDNVRGSKYALQALENGAKHAVLEDKDVADILPEGTYTLVENTLFALQLLARHHRRQLETKIIGVTGSNGKTTTKELLASVLKECFSVFATPGNFNSRIGLPLSLLSVKPTDEVAIIEMGAGKIGDIETLCAIAEPDYGIITNIGEAHLETFESVENIFRTKTELYDYLSENNGIAFVNGESLDLLQKLDMLNINYETYGTNDENEKKRFKIQDVDPIRIEYNGVQYNSTLSKRYNAINVMSAITVGSFMGCSVEMIQRGLANYVSDNNRSQEINHDGITYILDAYNANPSSVLAVLDAYKEEDVLFVIGDMYELGDYEEVKHRQIVEQAFEKSLKVVFVGDKFYQHKGLITNTKTIFFKEIVSEFDLIKAIESLKVKKVLLKGSRSMRLETLLEERGIF